MPCQTSMHSLSTAALPANKRIFHDSEVCLSVYCVLLLYYFVMLLVLSYLYNHCFMHLSRSCFNHTDPLPLCRQADFQRLSELDRKLNAISASVSSSSTSTKLDRSVLDQLLKLCREEQGAVNTQWRVSAIIFLLLMSSILIPMLADMAFSLDVLIGWLCKVGMCACNRVTWWH